jgi:predicted dehydrogenase
MDKVRVAIVGLGGHGRTIRRALKRCPNISVAGCYDIDEDESRYVSMEFNCRIYSGYDELVADPGVDGVILVTPNFLHFEQTMMALNYGKDVFVEKPIAVNVNEGVQMVELAERKQLILQVGHNTRKMKAFRKAKELLLDNSIGKIVSVEANVSYPGGLGVYPEWKADEKLCPLLPMMQLGIHFIDTLHYLIGEVKSVGCIARNAFMDKGNVDSAVAVIEFSNGVIGTLHSHYIIPDVYEVKIMGTDGIIRCSLGRVEIERKDSKYSEVKIFKFDEDIESYVEEDWIESFESY